MQEVCEVDSVEYISFEALSNPTMKDISEACIQIGFESEKWTAQFQTITVLRQANKHYSTIFITELMSKFYKQIIAQVENLRSNNSKQALTLLTEIFTTQDLNKISSEIIRPMINVLFLKSTSEKGFIKNQALKAISKIPNIVNPFVTEQLMNLTKSNNGSISELAIKTINQLLQKNQIMDVSQQFLKDLSYNINGKRAVVQKQAKQILNGFKKRVGEQKLQAIIDEAKELDQQESNTLKRQLKKAESIPTKAGGNFKDFMKSKKAQSN